jgi:RimJ/RimL family protein N-acetyltransferase
MGRGNQRARGGMWHLPEPPADVSSRSDPRLLPDAYFVALHGAEYVGQSVLWANKTAARLDTGLTGVKRSFRSRGLALALKLRGVAYAKAHSFPTIMTSNDSLNLSILAINEKLGFVKDPAMILFARSLM